MTSKHESNKNNSENDNAYSSILISLGKKEKKEGFFYFHSCLFSSERWAFKPYGFEIKRITTLFINN